MMGLIFGCDCIPDVLCSEGRCWWFEVKGLGGGHLLIDNRIWIKDAKSRIHGDDERAQKARDIKMRAVPDAPGARKGTEMIVPESKAIEMLWAHDCPLQMRPMDEQEDKGNEWHLG